VRCALAIALVLACSAHDRGPERPGAAPSAVVAPGLRLPEGVTPLSYDLRLELDPDRDRFEGHAEIRVHLAAPADHFWIHADHLQIARATFSGGTLTALPVVGDQMTAFSFGRTVTEPDVTISFDYTGSVGFDEEGVFRERADGRWYLYTQGQSVFARRILPCFDEPRFKTPWTVKLVVPQAAVALANMPQTGERALPDGRREVAFAETPAMPSYLLAVAVGPFELVDAGTVGRNKVPVRVAALAGQRGRVGVVRAQLPRIVDAAERLLDDALPLQKLDLVVVPHLFGAMENPGLITFDEPALVGDATRTAFAHHFARMAAHEIIHQWFGNLVTPAWWDDLWLAESFASWFGDRIAIELGAISDPDLEYAHQRRAALDADGEADAKPIRRRIEHNEDPDNAFDAISYSKGEIVLSMFDASVPSWTRSVRDLLVAHRSHAMATKDLLAVLVDDDTRAALLDAIDHTGAPIVEMSLRCAPNGVVDARVREGRTVPVCLAHAGGTVCKIVHAAATFELTGCPTWIRPNRHAGYYEVVWKSDAPLGPLPPITELGPRELLAWGDDLAVALGRGDLDAAHAIAAIQRLSASTDPYALLAAVAVAHALDPFFTDATRPAWTKFLAARFAPRLTANGLLGAHKTIELELRAELTELVPAADVPADTTRAAARELDLLISRSLPDPALAAFAAPIGGHALFDHLAQLARGSHDLDIRHAAIEALGKLGPDQLDHALEFFLHSPDLTGEEAWPAVAGYLDRASTRAAAWRTVSTHLSKIVSRMTVDEAPAVIASCASLCEPTSHADVASAFEPRLHDIAEGRQNLDKALATIDRCVARRARAGDLAHALP
jgi:alanyl aminopeptidase